MASQVQRWALQIQLQLQLRFRFRVDLLCTSVVSGLPAPLPVPAPLPLPVPDPHQQPQFSPMKCPKVSLEAWQKCNIAMPVFEERRGGGGSGTTKVVSQKRPKSIFPFVNFIFSHHEIWVQGGGSAPLLLAVLIHPWGGGYGMTPGCIAVCSWPPPDRPIWSPKSHGPAPGMHENGGSWDPKVCVPEIVQLNISFCTFRFFPL